MTFQETVRRDLDDPTNLKVIWTVSTIAGGVVVLTALLVALRQLQRRRKSSKDFEQACSRDPSLTWGEYIRKERLTRSRLMFEEEIQRSVMIRKCQQSRTSDYQETITGAESVTRPAQCRSRTWHDNSRSAEWEGSDIEQARSSPRQVGGDWQSAEASVDRTWQQLHRSRSPPGSTAMFWNQTGELQRSPSVRPKTPPLLSHPLFRDGNKQSRPKHASLPAELARARTELRTS